MNKKLLTLAIAAAIAAPMTAAQADVKVYGAAQIEIANVKNDGTGNISFNSGNIPAGTTKTSMFDNKRGRLGVSADEDLGGSMKGLAKFEWNLDTADNVDNTSGGGTNSFSPRDSYVGLGGGFGTLRLGRSGSPYKMSGVALDPFVTTSLEARNNFGMSGNKDGYGVLNAHNSFVNSGIFYTSPSLAGIMLDVYMGADDTGLDSTTASQGAQTGGDLSAVVSWKGGPAKVFVGYSRLNNTAPANGFGEPKSFKIGGEFKIGNMHNIAFQYEKADVNHSTNVGTLAASPTTQYASYGAKADYLFLSYTLTLGNFSLIPQLGQMKSDGGTLGDLKGDYLVLGGIYKMSKTFRTFAGYRASKLQLATVTADPRDEKVITIGLRKDF